MTIRDRGRIKWTSLMLPEHVKMLRNLWNNEFERIPKPILDEMELEEIDKKICYSFEFSFKVKMRVWEEGHINEFIGYIHKMDQFNKSVYLKEKLENQETTRIKYEKVLAIDLLDD